MRSLLAAASCFASVYCDEDEDAVGEPLSIWRARLARATFGALLERRLRSFR